MSPTAPLIPWPQVVKFVRQLNHDLRNHLNAVELQLAFVAEIAEGTETKAEIKRLRGMTAEMGAHLHRLSEQLNSGEAQKMPYPAADLVEDLRARVTAAHPETETAMEWQLSLGNEEVEVDPHLVLEAFEELFRNALTHGRGDGPLVFDARAEGVAVVFSLREPKSEPTPATADWGRQPLTALRAGHYGLGLFRARGIFAAHNGTMETAFDADSGILTTRVRLPRVAA